MEEFRVKSVMDCNIFFSENSVQKSMDLKDGSICMALHPMTSHNAPGQDLMGLIDGDEVEKINDAPFNLEAWRGVRNLAWRDPLSFLP